MTTLASLWRLGSRRVRGSRRNVGRLPQASIKDLVGDWMRAGDLEMERIG